ncbi:MAG: transcription-repair coupling factor [Lachnospiraceae bacterium]|nr:transcription-repair coupling factor [Lachnospiraceae bacterium]
MKTFISPLYELEAVDTARKELNTPGIVEINGCQDAVKLHMAYSLGENFTHKVLVTFSEQRAREIVDEYSFYDKNVYLYPAKDMMFYQADIHGNMQTKERLKCIKAVLKGEAATIVTTFDALMNNAVPAEKIANYISVIKKNETINVSELAKQLVSLGYIRNYQVETEGQFSIRGGIIDIFPMTDENPVRIELWGDDVDSIRLFDVSTQRSLKELDEITVFPASETVLTEEEKENGIKKIEKDADKISDKFRKQFKTEEAFRITESVRQFKERMLELNMSDSNVESYIKYFYSETVSLVDYFDINNTLFILDEPARLSELAKATELEFTESMKHRLEKGYAMPLMADILFSAKETMVRVSLKRTVALSSLPVRKSVYKIKADHSVVTKPVSSYNSSFESLIKDLKKYKKNGYRVIVVSASRTKAARLAEDLRQEEISAFFTDDLEREVKPSEVMVVYGRLKQGFEYPLLKFVVISESDIFALQKRKKHRVKRYDGTKIRSMNELSVGDYVVHESHGVGIYQGIEKVTVEDITKDYMKITYKDGGRLFIPATALDQIQKYASKDGSTPKINKLGGKEWENTKSKVKLAVEEIAGDLVDLYSKRRERNGYVYGKDTVWQTEFEELFPFEETEDQINAIMDTKADMESTKIMDRLICGDVGYGKTEIAIRAAFKAVQEGKQVIYLVPTTILAGQHYNTFKERMKDFPIRVDMLSRFKTTKEQKDTIKNLKNGMVDIVIGTHRLLSKDVEFKDPGLLIIDEEQRFGVSHKEKIKKLKESIDVLTLTATPIPRTLHMSLIGVRDMSVLEEAPQDRMPIQTFVMEYNEELVREAIVRELSRGGQVFYVYNRVNNIADIAASIKELVPEAEVAFAHGKMNETELENIMYDFVNGEIDVLVSTTIIETGLDIPNVNTMIIHDSDKLGLSQLYQLRGRVGRSNRAAYAFLMYRKDKLLQETAEKRLEAIRDFTELGSGFKIAMRDLEIRGAGNILGVRQSGHMAAVGYDLYCKMLNEAVRLKKGEEIKSSELSTTVELNVDAYIPDAYITNEHQKLDIYKRISVIESLSEKEDMIEELTDRFGKLPKAVLNLLDIAYLRSIAKEAYITEIKGSEGIVNLRVYENAKYDGSKIPDFIMKYKGSVSLRPSDKPCFTYRMKRDESTGDDQLARMLEFVDEIKKNIVEV